MSETCGGEGSMHGDLEGSDEGDEAWGKGVYEYLGGAGVDQLDVTKT